MFKALWSIGNDGFDKIEALRRDVNVKGRGIAEDEEFDAVDSFAGHVYVAFRRASLSRPEGCIRI